MFCRLLHSGCQHEHNTKTSLKTVFLGLWSKLDRSVQCNCETLADLHKVGVMLTVNTQAVSNKHSTEASLKNAVHTQFLRTRISAM